MADFKIIDIPAMLSVPVRSYDVNGNEIRDDGEWHRHVSKSLYIFAELLAAKGLMPGKTVVARTPDLVIKWSDLSEVGQAFVKTTFDKWLKSIDDIGMTEEAMIRKLEKRWQKFAQQHPVP